MRAMRATLDRVAPGAKAILFGSRARGDARPDSDWDVLILLDKDRITKEDNDMVGYPLVELGWDIDEDINPILYTESHWRKSSFTPFHHNVTNEGIAL